MEQKTKTNGKQHNKYQRNSQRRRDIRRKLIYNKILETSDIPKKSHKSIPISTFKKEQETRPENYRGITLLNSTIKLFTKIIKEKMEAHITNREEQQGFRRNRSTTNAIFIIKQVKEKAIKFNTPVYVCYID